MSNTDAGYTPDSGPQPIPDQTTTQRKPFPWQRLLLSLLFAFIGWFAFWVAIVVSVINWILIGMNREPHPDFQKFVRGVVQYVSQSLAYAAWVHDDKPFPFGPLPKGD